MTGTDLAAVRARSWETRRAKYGPKGHSSSYARRTGACAHCAATIERLRALVVTLHVEGILSEGQAAKATGLDRVALRKLADAQGGAP